MNENFETCKRIAAEVEAYDEGRVYRCPECGTLVEAVHEDRPVCFGCTYGETLEEPCSLFDYLADALDIEYVVGGDRKTLRGVRVLVTFGGPNIYVDTMKRAVTLHWWGEQAQYDLDPDVCEAIDDCAQELWNMG